MGRKQFKDKEIREFMDLSIKYNFPHTFFLSVGIICLIFGLCPYYFNNFDFSKLSLTQNCFHFGSILIAIVCILKGLDLWGKKETEKTEFADLRKKTINQQIELQEINLQERTLNNKILILQKELESLDSANKKRKTEIEDEIKRLNDELKAKKDNLENVTNGLYQLKKEEVLKTPDSFFSEASGAITVSGSRIYSYSIYPNKKCSICGQDYFYNPSLVDSGICDACKSKKNY